MSAGPAVLGVVLPAGVLRTEWFAVLAAFVAINTLVYVVLAVAKAMPKMYLQDWIDHRGRRRATRSIYPDAPPDA